MGHRESNLPPQGILQGIRLNPHPLRPKFQNHMIFYQKIEMKNL